MIRSAIKVEVLDIIKGFSYCSSKEYSTQELSPWEKELRDKLKVDMAIFKELTQHADADIANFANQICGFLEEEQK